jgi:hypothetical protein
MSGYSNIEKKLHQFSSKYYKNELIKGVILFFSLGVLYLFFTLFIEYFLWLKPLARTVLFWSFIFVEITLLVRFIFIPISKLIGLRKGISLEQSSTIIGNHFPEVQDKLLNILQLNENANQSDLIFASIKQKAKELQPIPFLKAINFKKNFKYLKYAIVPIFIWIITLFTGTNGEITQSLKRVMDHRTVYNPPAPFTFYVTNDELKVVQGKPFTVFLKTEGKVVPNEAKITFDNQQYFLQNNGNGTFSFTFSEVSEPIQFYVASNEVQSQDYQIIVIETPTIQNISMQLKYPRYVAKRNEVIHNTGNITVPQGTRIEWHVQTNQTDSLTFLYHDQRKFFTQKEDNKFVFTKRILQEINYQITSSNKNLKEYEKLQFSVDVVKDDFPVISIKSDIDSISRGTASFGGQVSDDYGIKRLQIVYYNDENPSEQKTFDLPITRETLQTFYYQFPDGLDLKKGVNYELFFQVFDNDGVNGSKKSVTRKFNYRQKTSDEIEEELLQEQKNYINDLENSIEQQKNQKKDLEKIQRELQNKKSANWNDKKKVQSFVKRQEQYKQMMQRQTDKLQENLGEKKEENENLQNKKETLKKRIEELKKQDKQQKLLDEIQKIADKLNKEDLLKKAKELAQQNKQQERSLERILELTKRFYVEQKATQLANKLEKLSKKQDSVQQKTENALEAQKEIKKEFEKIEKDLEELSKDNEKLKEPMEFPDTEDEKESVKEELKKSEENLENNKSSEAKKSQKKASKKMKEMSKKMQASMDAMQGETLEENTDDLRKILENLVTFSFKQEGLMNKFGDISTAHPDFGKSLKIQNQIKTYFEHIDDSLYVLAMRVPTISAKIQDDLSLAHYNLDQSLENFSENRFPNGISNQRYVMTAANSLADYLSNVLSNMKNSMSMGKGKGKGKSPGFSLPDLIEKQKGLGEKMEKGSKKGNKPGQKPGQGKKPGEGSKPGESGEKGKPGKNGKPGEKGEGGKSGKGGKSGGKNGEGDGENEDFNGEIYQIYKEQSQLRQQLAEAIKNAEQSESGKGGSGNAKAKRVLKTMEQLENEILEKGFNTTTLQKMQQLNYELLKLDEAKLKQGKDKKRKSNTNSLEYQKRKAKELQFKKLFYNQIEILNRQSLPLQQNYKKKVQEYFSEPEKK